MTLWPIAAETAASFFAVAVLLGLAPGPDNLFVLTQSLAHGARAGWAVTLGLCTGLIGHTLAVSLGLAAVLVATPWAMQAIQIAGAIYLLRVAWGAWQAAPAQAQQALALSSMALWRRGVIMNISNPKVALFFLALLPQFVDPARGEAVPQLLALGGLFMLATWLVFGAMASFAAALGQGLRRHAGAQSALNRLAAVVLCALALRLLWGVVQPGA